MRHGRLRAALALVAMVVMGCGSSESTPVPATMAVPESIRTALDQCMLDAGFRPVKTRPPDSPLNEQNTVVEWERMVPGDIAPAVAMVLVSECRERFAPRRELTEDEVRAVHARWVQQYECLVDLGHHPHPPPSVETFISTWDTGPWMPTDGVPMETLSEARFREAKDRCTLEFYER